MAQNKIQSKYAKALLECLGNDSAKVSKMVEELRGFSNLVKSHDELKLTLTTDIFPSDDRKNILEDLVKKSGISDEVRRTLLVLSESKRLGIVDGIADRLNQLLLDHLNTALVTILSASALDADAKAKLEKKFEKVLCKKVELNYEILPSLIGGLKAEAGGRTYDGTLTTWLQTFEESAYNT